MRKVLLSCAIIMFTSCWHSSASPASGSAEQRLETARAWIVVDHSDGAIISAHNDRVALPPASLTKLMTALVAEKQLSRDEPLVVSRRAAETPPTKLNIAEGERWLRDTLLNAMLLASANDTAIALAENASGSLESFSEARRRAAADLGLQDLPEFNDPSGLDSVNESHDGGDLISARDMAMIARAVLATPELAEIVARTRHDFVAPNGKQRYVRNHNKMLTTYPGMIGMKTGYTKRAQHTFAGAATRDGRTLLVVVLGAPSPYPLATKLLDEGFASQTPAGGEKLDLRTLDTRDSVPVVQASSNGAESSAIAAVMATAFLALRTRSNAIRRKRRTRS